MLDKQLKAPFIPTIENTTDEEIRKKIDMNIPVLSEIERLKNLYKPSKKNSIINIKNPNWDKDF